MFNATETGGLSQTSAANNVANNAVTSSHTVVIIGGGAAGFFAAIACANANQQVHVILLEHTARVLNKVRISGGGRCNVTHACFEPAQLVNHYPRGQRELLGPFHRFQPRNTVDWFEARDVSLKTEADGRIFPITDQSATIVDCLTREARHAGVEVRTNTSVSQLSRAQNQFELQLKDGTTLMCDRLLLATGSGPHGYTWAREMGHTIVPPVPSLFTFNVKDERLEGLPGIAVEDALVKLMEPSGDATLQQRGPVLITHWGLSGPAVLKLSAWAARELHTANYTAPIEINWLPQLRDEDIIDRLTARKHEAGSRQIVSHSPFHEIPARLWKSFVHAAHIFDEQQWVKLPKANLLNLGAQLSHGRYAVRGKGQFKDEFVTCGGVKLSEINFKTMESRVCAGLFFAGEILDIDGVTGGFNFQNAWTTGWLAGQALAVSGS